MSDADVKKNPSLSHLQLRKQQAKISRSQQCCSTKDKPGPSMHHPCELNAGRKSDWTSPREALARAWVPLVHGAFAAFLVLVGPGHWPVEASQHTIYVLCLLFSVLAVWCHVSWRIHAKRWVDPYSLFLLAAILFNGGRCLLEVFQLNPGDLMEDRFSNEVLLKTIYMVTLGITFFHGGALCTGRETGQSGSRESQPQELPAEAEQDRRLLVWIGGILVLVSLPTAFLELARYAQAVGGEGYMAVYQGEMRTGLSGWQNILALFLAPGCLMLLSGGRKSRVATAVSALIVLAYAMVRIYVGERFHALMPVIIYAWLWHRCVRPIPGWMIATAIVGLLMVVLPLVRSTREVSGSERLSFGYLYSAYFELEHPALSTISEVGGSMRTVAETVRLVPDEYPHEHGESYLFAALTVAPNIMGDLHPTIAKGTPSQWVTERTEPIIAAQGGSLGYSFIAEAYLNFGWPGVPLVLAALGFAYARFVRWADQPAHAARIALLASCAVVFTFYARAETASIVRWLSWYCLGPYLLFQIGRRRPRPHVFRI